MKKLLFILLLTGCTVTKPGTDEKLQELDTKVKNIAAAVLQMNSSITTLNEYSFPQAMKVSKANNNCPVNLKTNKCIKK